MLAATATDLMVLAGVQPGACERLYGSHPVRGRLGPEGGLRILLAYLARTARAEGRSVRPLLAYVRGHHLRVYLEVGPGSRESPSDPVGMAGEATWTGPYLGDRGPYGPMWLGPLFDPRLAPRLTAPSSAARPRETEEFLARIRSEAEVDQPFYYEANELAGALGLPFPPSRAGLARALAEQGYGFARTHMRPEGFGRTHPARWWKPPPPFSAAPPTLEFPVEAGRPILTGFRAHAGPISPRTRGSGRSARSARRSSVKNASSD